MRKSTNVVLFLVMVNAAAAAMQASGLNAYMGIAPQPGAGAAVEASINALRNISPSAGVGSTLFSLYVAVTQGINAFFQLIFAGPTMMANLGAPAWLTAFVFAPQYIIAGLDVVYALTGRSM